MKKSDIFFWNLGSLSTLRLERRKGWIFEKLEICVEVEWI